MYILVRRRKSPALDTYVRACVRVCVCVCPGLRNLFVPSMALRRPRRAPMSTSWGARDPPVEPDRQHWTGGAG